MQSIYDTKILLVDDSTELVQLVRDHLRGAGYTNVSAAAGCREARRLFDKIGPELLILDVNLPDGDGFALFRELRAGIDIPALFLSARDADADRLYGLGLGADDYLTKPFLVQELLLRMERILSRCYRTRRDGGLEESVSFGGRLVHLADAAVEYPDGGGAMLTATERALLSKLYENRGHIVTYDGLCEAIWGADYYGYKAALTAHMRNLREKVEEDPSHPKWLLTVKGIGYKLAKEGA